MQPGNKQSLKVYANVKVEVKVKVKVKVIVNWPSARKDARCAMQTLRGARASRKKKSFVSVFSSRKTCASKRNVLLQI